MTMKDDYSMAETLRSLSTQAFQSFGTGELVYVRPVNVENRDTYGLYSAEGALLTVQDSPEILLMLARHNSLEAMTVH